jgi:hypothetical protein
MQRFGQLLRIMVPVPLCIFVDRGDDVVQLHHDVGTCRALLSYTPAQSKKYDAHFYIKVL